MATAFTHSFVGAMLAPLVPQRVPRWPLLIVLAALPFLPDLDVVGFRLGIPYHHPFGHRGFSHSLVFALFSGFSCALLFARWFKPFAADWLKLGAVLSLAVASHGLLDAMTDAGLGVAFFWPFDSTRYFLPVRPLATSPIGLTAFFNGDAWRILANELIWVWLPMALVGALLAWLGRQSRTAPPG